MNFRTMMAELRGEKGGDEMEREEVTLKFSKLGKQSHISTLVQLYKMVTEIH